MALLPILKYPHPLLEQASTAIAAWDEHLKALVTDMFETMYRAKGLGLAAIQVAVPLRVFVADVGRERRQPQVFINPRIVKQSGQIDSVEGCLSYPGFEGLVRRSARVRVEAWDLEHKKFSVNASALGARVMQHEIDHLDGILFMRKAVPGTVQAVEKKSGNAAG